jgi:uncharacterized membrane protein
MLTTKKIENIMGMLLLIGTLISASLVCIGGFLFLLHHGSEPIHSDLLKPWTLAFSWNALGLIELGLFLLVFTQILRVLLLCGFYVFIRDRCFTLISFFILFVLIYSVFWRA